MTTLDTLLGQAEYRKLTQAKAGQTGHARLLSEMTLLTGRPPKLLLDRTVQRALLHHEIRSLRTD